jgi:zinc and cadmium transporter
MADHVNVTYLLPFAAGNFVYIAAADLLPEISSEPKTVTKFQTTSAFVVGLVILLVTALVF